MLFCPSCSAENAEGSQFCSACGTALKPEHQPTVTYASPGDSTSFSDSSYHGRFLPGSKVGDRYRIVSLVGKGGMGEVYRADDLKLGHPVALKFLPKELAADQRRLDYFHSEVRLSRQISHPNVCRVYDIGEVDGHHFLSMEYVDGEDLKGLLRRIGRLPKDKGIEIAQQLCAGLAAAHDKGVLHRDLKPANIMIDGGGQVRITDFGLAKSAADGVDAEVSGTPAYMAPEQLADGRTTIQSDLYSLGLVLYELFTGEAVHKSNSVQELLHEHRESSISQPSDLVDDMDPAVQRVIVRCLLKEASQRPKSAREVAASLPGADPLLAALAAGETPSPQMVAAAGDDSRMDWRMAGFALCGIAVCLALNVWIADWTTVFNRSALDYEPAVLRDEVREMLEEDFGYEESAGEMIHGFTAFPNLNDGTISFWARYRPVGVAFEMNAFWGSRWRRFSRARPEFFVPKWDEPGELGVVLSGDKRLLYFRAIPPVEMVSEGETSTARWSEWFTAERTGFYLPTDGEGVPAAQDLRDAQVLEIVPGKWLTPPGPFDAIGVWKGRDPHDGSTFLVEAAAFRGMPTYFNRIPQETFESLSHFAATETDGVRRGRIMFNSLDAVMIVVGVVLAWRNLRLGRGDRRGGMRLAAYVFAANTVVLLTHCRHTTVIPPVVELVLTMGFAQVLFATARTWIYYMALEPYVRRIWPQILISLSRLLDGRIRDPLVGRNVLVGILFGVVVSVVFRLNFLVQSWLGVGNLPRVNSDTLALSGAWELLGVAFDAHLLALFVAFGALMFLLVSRIALNSERRAMIAFLLVLPVFLALLLGGRFPITWIATVIHYTLMLLLLVRFGILALVVEMTTNFLINAFPLTHDTTHWYFGHGMFAVVLIAAFALFGFFTSLDQWRKVSPG